MGKKTLISVLLQLLLVPAAFGQSGNLFLGSKVAVSSCQDKFSPEGAVDGKYTKFSAWMSNRWKTPPHILDITLPYYAVIDSVVVFSGIPENEQTAAEKKMAPGFHSVKNLSLQYWDDANWTDIPETVVTENRLDRLVLRLERPVTSFRFRLVSTDGEPVRIIEIEGYGKVDQTLKAPIATDHSSSILDSRPERTMMKVKVRGTQSGKSLKYVAYNQGYFVPGCNAPAWWEYSGVNAARIWADLKTYVHPQWLSGDFRKAATEEDFKANREKFLKDPLRYMPLDSLDKTASEVIASTNTMSFKYALETLKALGIDIVLQSGIEREYHNASWENKWELWQRFYTLAYYAAREGNMTMMALNNEPNHRHAGPMPLDAWIQMSEIAADALHAAVPGARFVGPVTAGTNTNWWEKVARSGVVDIFSTHSYNVPAIGYEGRVTMIDDILRKNTPDGTTRPVVFTETGRWMNAYLIDKEETMDSPSLFTEWAGMYVRNMKEGCYGMWAFKFANTASATYPHGIKSGHHYIWRGKRFVEDAVRNYALNPSSKVTDGDKSSYVMAVPGEPITVDLGGERQIGGFVVYSGSEGGVFTAPDRAREMKFEYLSGGEWKTLPDPAPAQFKYAQHFYTIDPSVTASALRVTVLDHDPVKIREIKVFPEGALSDAQKSFDVGGVQRTAEVVRLFAKGFKDQRPVFDCDLSSADRDFDAVASRDPETGLSYMWLVQRNAFSYTLDIDLGEFGIAPGTPVVCETVDKDNYGEAKILTVSPQGRLSLRAPQRSVMLLTFAQGSPSAVKAKSAFSVCLGSQRADTRNLKVEMNASDRSCNSVSYISFDLSKLPSDASRILLSLDGKSNAVDHQRLHVYCFEGLTKPCPWDKAPHLSADESRITGVGGDVHVAGEITFASEAGRHCLDVSEVVRKNFKDNVTFVVVREVREAGDDYDNGIYSTINPETAELIVW